MHGNTADPQPHNDSPAVIRERQRALLDAFNETHVYVGDGALDHRGEDRCETCGLPVLNPRHKAPVEFVGLRNYWLKDPPQRAVAALNTLEQQGFRNDERATCPCGKPFHGYSVRCRPCVERCPHILIPGYIAMRDGRYAPRQYCGICGARQMPDAPASKVIFNVCFDDPRDQYPPEPCERCKSVTGTQLHHWAPIAIFQDAWDWPMSWLCPFCHELWHKAMRQAGGYRLPDGERAAVPASGLILPGGRA